MARVVSTNGHRAANWPLLEGRVGAVGLKRAPGLLFGGDVLPNPSVQYRECNVAIAEIS